MIPGVAKSALASASSNADAKAAVRVTATATITTCCYWSCHTFAPTKKVKKELT